MRQLVRALTLQKADGVGQLAATTVAALCSKVVENPGEARFRAVPWAPGKAAYVRIAPSAAGLPLLRAVGWAVDAERSLLELPEAAAADTTLLQLAASAVLAELHAGAFA